MYAMGSLSADGLISVASLIHFLFANQMTYVDLSAAGSLTVIRPYIKICAASASRRWVFPHWTSVNGQYALRDRSPSGLGNKIERRDTSRLLWAALKPMRSDVRRLSCLFLVSRLQLRPDQLSSYVDCEHDTRRTSFYDLSYCRLRKINNLGLEW